MAKYTIEKLQDKLDKNISYRKKELTVIKTMVQQSQNNIISTNIRIAIVMLYAHWEGFIKVAAREFLKYLNDMNIYCYDMKENFITLSIKTVIRDCGKSLKTEKYNEITRELMKSRYRLFKVDPSNKLIIDTESNLSYPVLKDILFALGLEYSKYELKKNYINENLIDKRNAIAHGELIEIKSDDFDESKHEFEELYKEIIGLMNLFKEQIMDAAVHKSYLKIS
ncbi:MAE_28990/MAE_18760 family HEPN-like nuclease [Clostridium scatologenes]|uniref:RiboL-PSP-HEPN domain-containing protein n=1 Tax=Clostridium scatologenes TaxID=1548 RepID=A0A0E3GSM0_CLOSL|nr:MAE_28990/MAE_18760 family HEPN-like nuclease [Clostridium scatologenes]AKA72306.1 hypothetical protein CSCA_5181 [Clostridium scatologenes]